MKLGIDKKGVRVKNCNVIVSGGEGIIVIDSHGNRIKRSSVTDGEYGFSFGNSNDNEIKRNKACNNPSGNFVEINSTGNDLEDNQFCP
jgi:parallel beta-helix repeat protein